MCVCVCACDVCVCVCACACACVRACVCSWLQLTILTTQLVKKNKKIQQTITFVWNLVTHIWVACCSPFATVLKWSKPVVLHTWVSSSKQKFVIMLISRFFQTSPIAPCNRSQSKHIYIAKFGLRPLSICSKDLHSTIHTHCPKQNKNKNVLCLAMSWCHLQAPEWHEMYCFTLHRYQTLYVAVSCFMSWNAVALHARLCWTVWGLTVQDLTQTCDITMKDGYVYLS